MSCAGGIIPGQVDLIARRGYALSRTFYFFTDAPEQTAMPLLGWYGFISVKDAPNSTNAPLLSLNTNGTPSAKGSTLKVDQTSNTIALSLTALEINALPGATSAFPTDFYYDLVLNDPDGSTPYIVGTLTINPGVSL